MSTTTAPETALTSAKPASRPAPGIWSTIKWVLTPIASLQLTVGLFALSVLLVFFGTLAQIDNGIWTVVDSYFWSWHVWVPVQLLVQFAQVFFNVGPDVKVNGAFPFPAGITIGAAMMINLAAAHLVRFRVWSAVGEVSKGFKAGAWAGIAALFAVGCKRGGIVLIHSGIVLLFVGEWGTRLWQVEQRMFIAEGDYSDYAFDTRNAELALIDHSDPDTDTVIVVPASRLKEAVDAAQPVSDPALPFDIVVDEYADNSSVDFDAAGKPITSPATAGLGLKYPMTPRAEASGVEQNQTVDMPSAFVTFVDKQTQKPLGTYLVSLWFGERSTQTVEVGGKSYELALRFTRYYKPFRMYLDDFRHDKYIGTDKAKNFASHVRVVDPETGEERPFVIAMNEPLRYAGETFYQSSFDKETETTTELQVVNNPVVWLPYIACGLVSAGMLVYFAFFLSRFLWRLIDTGRPATGSTVKLPVSSLIPRPTKAERILPWALFALFALLYYGGDVARKAPKSDLDLSAVASIPVVEGGRQMPLDTKARVALRLINDSEQFKDQNGTHRSALTWFLDTASNAASGSAIGPDHRVLRIENDQLLKLLELEARPGSYRYSMEEVVGDPDRYSALQKTIDQARNADPKKSDAFQRAAVELGKHLGLYHTVMVGETPLVLPPTDDTEWRAGGMPDWMTERLAVRITEQMAQQISDQMAQIAVMKTVEEVLGFTPESKEELDAAVMKMTRDQQKAFGDKLKLAMAEAGEQARSRAEAESRAQVDALRAERNADPAAVAWHELLAAYKAGDQERLDAAAAALKAESGHEGTPSPRMRLELGLNRFAPFYHAIWAYVGVVLLSLLGLFMVMFRPGLSEGIRRTSFWILVATFIVHTVTLLARMYLMDRPLVFVTNLYSSAVFIGWAGVGLGLIVERIFPIGLGNIVAAVLGAVGTLVAHQLAASGDTMEMMQAVLDTNFWLATHVTTVTLGYAATYVAGLVGIIYIALGILTPALRQPVPMGTGSAARTTDVGRMIGMILYGVICLATMLSFVGTVLGGIWADQSWGRFWGWDPKENGAVLIVAWNALILHARWAGLVKDRGVAVLALVGNMITTWSWFGTNQLSVGLHAYGFNKTLAEFCVYVWVSHLVLIAVGMTPQSVWASYAGVPTAKSAPVVAPPKGRRGRG